MSSIPAHASLPTVTVVDMSAAAERADIEAMVGDPSSRTETEIVTRLSEAGFEPRMLEPITSGVVAMTPGAILAILRMRLQDTDAQIEGIMQQLDENTARSNAIQEQVEALGLLKSAMSTKQTDGATPVGLGDVQVEFRGESLSGAELLNRLGVTDLSVRHSDGVVSGSERDPLAGVTTRSVEEIKADVDRSRRKMMETFPPDPRSMAVLDSLVNELSIAEKRDAGELATIPPGYTASATLTGDSLDSHIQALQTLGRRQNSSNEMLMVQMQSAMQARSQSVTMATQMVKSLNDSANAVAQNIGR